MLACGQYSEDDDAGDDNEDEDEAGQLEEHSRFRC